MISLGLALGAGGLIGSLVGGPNASSAVSGTETASVAAAAQTADTAPAADSASGAVADPAANPETPLEGDMAAKVTAAAQAAVPGGTVDRVETDNDGVYEAHVTTADGNEVIVQVGADFQVTATVDHPAGGRGGRGGGHAAETPLEGDIAAGVTAAAQAAVPDGTVDRVETDSDGSPYEAHVTKADGTQVVVKVGEDFVVTATEDAPAGGHHGPGGRHGDRSARGAADAADDAATATTTG